jgi:uncharacterized membrane protein YraQ (UPF0718 family)
MSNSAAVGAQPPGARSRLGGLALLLLIVTALFYYKWGGSLRVLAAVGDTGRLAVSPAKLFEGGLLAGTRFYFGKIWPALTYGILVGAAVRAAIPARWIRRWLGDGATRPTFLGVVVGAPLMLCSCCVTPIFSGLYERGARLGPALAVMLASPGLNVAALVLTFALLPMRVALLRLGAAALIVVGLPAIVGRVLDRPRADPPPAACDVPASSADEADVDPSEDMRPAALAVRFGKSILYMTAITVPLIVVGVLLSGLIMPYVTSLTATGVVITVALVALVATCVALPTFFEIPIALMLLAAGAPVGAAVAFVVAGPIVNLASLFVLGRETRPRVAVSVAAGVWLVATVSGLVSTL